MVAKPMQRFSDWRHSPIRPVSDWRLGDLTCVELEPGRSDLSVICDTFRAFTELTLVIQSLV